jgi:autoinducer 2-degrading protein
MFVVSVTVHVKPECVKPFIAAILENARGTRAEPGNIRFDVLQSQDDPTHFMLYECYKGPADFAAHQQTAHYARWKAAAADWMAGARSAVKCKSLFFGDAEG